jgi:hypothetical protein
MMFLGIDWAPFAWPSKVALLGLGGIAVLYVLHRMMTFRERR